MNRLSLKELEEIKKRYRTFWSITCRSGFYCKPKTRYTSFNCENRTPMENYA
ncbi:hypothetical protein LEP1GSC073_1637 [Leptospira noguchii str. Cascata]|nr:hypothetical protein LEP1GSC073_1637 [Leptospira noguchii str. Cascata]